MTLGERIKAERERQHMTQYSLALHARIDQSNLCKIEKGRLPRITVPTLRRIAKALRITCGRLLD